MLKGEETDLAIHPNDLRLEALYLANEREDQETLKHLSQCRRCRGRFRAILRERQAGTGSSRGEEAEPPHQLGGDDEDATQVDSLTLALALTLARERFAAPGLLVELIRCPAERREALLGSLRFHTWGLFELLVERSLETVTRDPEGAEELGLLALDLSAHLNAFLYGAERIEDLRARSWAHIANARRLRSALRAADEAFRRAASHLSRGTGDPLERAILLDLEASLRRAQRRFPEALDLLRLAIDLFLETGNRHHAGRSLVKMSTVHYFTGDLDQAVPLLARAFDLIDAEQEPRLLLCARHNLIDYLSQAGHFQEAQEIYFQNRALYRDFVEPWVQNRRRWVKGRIARGLGQSDLAESLLLAARDGFVAEGIPYDTALISLEIAILYAEQGRTAELKRLAGEMVPIFSSLQIHREALAALTFLKQAIDSERADVEVVNAVAGYLKRAQHEPGIRFQKPEGLA
jgi:tetratricopeptide (TPR) repeat protein